MTIADLIQQLQRILKDNPRTSAPVKICTEADSTEQTLDSFYVSAPMNDPCVYLVPTDVWEARK